MLASILTPLAILLTFSTAVGVFVHDMHIDSILAMPSSAHDTTTKLAGFGDAHTHVERSAMAQAIIHLQGQPRVQPRASEDKKHLMQNRVLRGHHAFDNYNLPMV
jgi:hypothetical protein